MINYKKPKSKKEKKSRKPMAMSFSDLVKIINGEKVKCSASTVTKKLSVSSSIIFWKIFLSLQLFYLH
jgi:hypothetical protein